MVMSWLWNSMVPEISDTCMFLPTAKEIWEAVEKTYSKVGDAAQIYEIKTKIAATKQGGRSVTEYANLLKILWQEMDYYQCFQMKCSTDAALMKRFVEKERIYEFLAGLNGVFDLFECKYWGRKIYHHWMRPLLQFGAKKVEEESWLNPNQWRVQPWPQEML